MLQAALFLLLALHAQAPCSPQSIAGQQLAPLASPAIMQIGNLWQQASSKTVQYTQ